MFYIIYLKKNDKIVAVGNAGECAEQLGCKSVRAFYALVSNVKHGKNKRYEIVTEKEGELE